jgi:hypothetical protein
MAGRETVSISARTSPTDIAKYLASSSAFRIRMPK